MLKSKSGNVYREGDLVYEVFLDYYYRDYLNSFVMSYIKELESRNNLIEDINKQAENQSLIFPRVANSLFLSIYGEFEYFLISVCNVYKKALNLRIAFNDLKGEGVIGALDYLDRVVGIHTAKNNKYYEKITHWNKIRNYLVHNAGIIDEKCLISVSKLNLKYISSFDNNVIALNFNNCKEFINITQNIQNDLLL